MLKTKKWLLTKRRIMKSFMGLKFSKKGLFYLGLGSLLLLGKLGIINWNFVWIIISIGLIVYGLLLCGADEIIKCKPSRKK
jgi:hypothetical protein